MVTTIKITCDGVFIQSNSYNHDNNATDTSPPLIAATKATTLHSNTTTPSTDVQREKSIGSIGKNIDKLLANTAATKSVNNSYADLPTASLNEKRNIRGQNIVDNGKSCEVRSDTRRRYYFGNNNSNNNNIYWCKQSLVGGSTPTGTRRSARSRKVLYAQKDDKIICDNKDFVHICNKFETQRQFTGNNKGFTLAQPKLTNKGKSAKSPLPLVTSSLKDNRRKYHTDTSLLSLLRDISARHLYRSDTEHQKQTKLESKGDIEEEVVNSTSMMLKLRSTLLATIIDRFPSPGATSTPANTTVSNSSNADTKLNKICNDWFG